MIGRYDPLAAPDPDEWLALDEARRLRLVEDYHRRTRVRLPNVKAHATMHVVVENQIALGDAIPVQRTAQRLMAEGLDRHDAIHAISAVLVDHMFDLVQRSASDKDPNPAYFAALDHITAESWQHSD